MNSLKVIITGANGFIGAFLVDYFSSRKYEVVAYVHSTPVVKNASAQYRDYDLDKGIHEPELEGCDYLIHCAYVKSGMDNHSDETNIQGTLKLYRAAREKHIKRFIYLSSLSAHAQARSHYGQMKYKIESMLDPHADVILKPGLVIGRGGLFQEIAGYIQRSAIIPLVGKGNDLIQCIAIDDLAKCIELAIEQDLVGIYPIAATTSTTLREMYLTISSKMNKKITLFPMPFGLIDLGLIILSGLHIRTPVTRENLLGLKQNKTWDVSQTARVFEIDFKPFPMAIELLSGSPDNHAQ